MNDEIKIPDGIELTPDSVYIITNLQIIHKDIKRMNKELEKQAAKDEIQDGRIAKLETGQAVFTEQMSNIKPEVKKATGIWSLIVSSIVFGIVVLIGLFAKSKL